MSDALNTKLTDSEIEDMIDTKTLVWIRDQHYDDATIERIVKKCMERLLE